MTKELMDACSEAMAEAIAKGDQSLIWSANARFNRAMMECQYKTANRVKWLVRAYWVLGVTVFLTAIGCGEMAVKAISSILGIG